MNLSFAVWVVTMLTNVLGTLIYWFTGGGIGMFLLSLLQIVIFTPCSFLFWYRPLYKAFRCILLLFYYYSIFINVYALFSEATQVSNSWYSFSVCCSKLDLPSLLQLVSQVGDGNNLHLTFNVQCVVFQWLDNDNRSLQ
jgi:hypothetical protein